jgi:hypothetical protein
MTSKPPKTPKTADTPPDGTSITNLETLFPASTASSDMQTGQKYHAQLLFGK